MALSCRELQIRSKVDVLWLVAVVLMVSASTEVMLAQTVVTYRTPQIDEEERYQYDLDVIDIALAKTTDEYGDYELRQSPQMSFARGYEELRSDNYPNLIFIDSANDENVEQYGHVPIPVAGGLFGYRVFLANSQVAETLQEVESLEDLREFTIGQGIGWLDVEILEESGFDVETVSHMDGLYRMTAVGRVDVFSRGVNEVLYEHREFVEPEEDLVLDDQVLLYYPMPRFMFTNQDNTELIERLELGLERAMNDGSFHQLWQDHFQENIDFVAPQDRLVLEIENPLIETLDLEEMQPYFFELIGE